MIRSAAPFFALILAACVPQSGSLTSEDTGLSGTYSAQAVISQDPHHVLMGHVIQTTRGADTVRALVISQRRDGVHRLRFAEAWMDGIRLPFVRAGALDGCTHGHCLDTHVGMILLSDAMFAHAQTHGLSAHLVGGAANIDIHAPRHLFALPEP